MLSSANLNPPNFPSHVTEDVARYIPSVALDKQIYRPGDPVYVRVVLLDAFTNKPIPSDLTPQEVSQLLRGPTVFVTNARGDEIFSGIVFEWNSEGLCTHSALSFRWIIPESLPAGQYDLQLRSRWSQAFVNTAVRSFDVIDYVVPTLKKELVYVKQAYSEGETVRALLKCVRAEGGFCDPSSTQISAFARLDGSEVYRDDETLNLSEDGTCFISFELPDSIDHGVGSLSVTITEGVTETVSLTLPVVLQKLDIDIYPEGGVLVPGVVNSVYCQARTPSNDPADFVAEVIMRQIEEEGEVEAEEVILVENVESMHEGRAVFDLDIPSTFDSERQSLLLRMIQPSGVKHCVSLTDLVESDSAGVSLRCSVKKAYSHNTPLEFTVTSPTSQQVYVALFRRERQLAAEVVELETGLPHSVSFQSAALRNLAGVMRVTVFSSAFVPMAERLVFVRPEQKLTFDIRTTADVYAPGDPVEVEIRPSLPNATVGVTVTNDSVRKMVEKRRRVPRLPAMHLLENEIVGNGDDDAFHVKLFDSMSYFETDEFDMKEIHPDVKIDLLLGTMGWRRFIYQSPLSPEDDDDDDVNTRRLLAIANSPLGPDEFFSLSVKTLTGKTIPISICLRSTVWDIKGAVRDVEGIPPDQQRIIMVNPYGKRGVQIMNDRTAGDYEMNPETMLYLVLRLRGGGGDSSGSGGSGENGAGARAGVMGREVRIVAGKPVGLGKGVEGVRDRPRPGIATISEEDEPKVHPLFNKPLLRYFRQFAHKANVMASSSNVERTDFTETLFYAAAIQQTDQADPIVVKFDLNDDISSFAVVVDGWTEEGFLGASDSFTVDCSKPFYIAAKIPLEVTFGDLVNLPVTLVNNTNERLTASYEMVNAEEEVVFFQEENRAQLQQLVLGAMERKTCVIPFEVRPTSKKNQKITIRGSTNSGLIDSFSREVQVVPFGYQQFENFGGLLNPDETVEFTFRLPEEIIDHSLRSLAYVSPSVFSNMNRTLNSLIQRPSGCFEQTSTTLYPMMMAVRHLEKMVNDPTAEKIMARAIPYLKSGYKRLVQYECSSGGFDWFGSDPGHPALTALGILEFMELSTLIPDVDMAMVNRTKKWLMTQRTATGFRVSDKHRHHGHCPASTTDAYICYALSKVDINFPTIVDRLEQLCVANSDGYVMALVALALFNYGEAARSHDLVERLAGLQSSDSGAITHHVASIVGSRGRNLDLETTGFAVMAFCNFISEFQPIAARAIDFIHTNQKCGTYGSSQATVLSLQAITMYEEAVSTADSSGVLLLTVNGTELRAEFEAGLRGSIVFDDFRNLLVLGEENVISLRQEDGITAPFAIQVDLFAPTPAFDGNDQELNFSYDLLDSSSATIAEGDVREIEVKLSNTTAESQSMTVAICTIPSGLTVRYEKLKELVRSGMVSHFEMFGAREVVFYWEALAAEQEIRFTFDVLADVPGHYRGAAASAYLYYGDEEGVVYCRGLEVEITANVIEEVEALE